MNEATKLIVYVATKQKEFLILFQFSSKAQVFIKRTTNEKISYCYSTSVGANIILLQCCRFLLRRLGFLYPYRVSHYPYKV